MASMTLWRYSNKDDTRKHLYTLDPAEPGAGWNFEMAACDVFTEITQITTPLLRYYKNESGDHFYTTDVEELGENGSQGYGREGDQGFVYQYPQPGSLAFYRYRNKDVGTHFYTTDVTEIPPGHLAGADGDGPHDWYIEKVQCYVIPPTQTSP